MYSEPLVSVVVVTYNSSKTIIETLESVKEQTYPNIELVISDDCSVDDTVDICEQWIEVNKGSFSSTILIKSKINTGVPANLNRGIKKAHGLWIKSIAGDDLLKPESIHTYLSYAKKNGFEICFARLELFPGTQDMYVSGYKNLEYIYKPLKTYNRRTQYLTSLFRHILPGPGLFYKRELWEKIGGFCEKYTRSEELAFQVKVFERVPVFFINEFLVKWRQRDNSLCHQSNSATLQQDLVDFYQDVQRIRLKEERMFMHLIDKDITVGLFKSKEEHKYILYLIMRFLSLFSLPRYIKHMSLMWVKPVFPSEVK